MSNSFIKMGLATQEHGAKQLLSLCCPFFLRRTSCYKKVRMIRIVNNEANLNYLETEPNHQKQIKHNTTKNISITKTHQLLKLRLSQITKELKI